MNKAQRKELLLARLSGMTDMQVRREGISYDIHGVNCLCREEVIMKIMERENLTKIKIEEEVL